MFVRTRFGLPAAALLAGLAQIAPAMIATALAAPPPPQPAEGAGGVGDKAATVVKRGLGHAGAATFAFYKGGPAPQEGRPIAVLLPAWGAPNPQGYGAWIDHLARNGWLVLVPRAQEVNRTRPADATANVLRLLKSALSDLASDAEAKPDAGRLAVIGHLAGAPLAANLAATAAAEGLPAPKLVFAVMPGGIASNPKSRGIPLADLDAIPARTLLVTVIGDRDARAADAAARRILRAAANVTPDHKLFVRALSDDHGFPALTATLTSPAGVDPAYDGDAIKLPPEPKDLPKEQRPPPFKWSPDMALSGEQTTLVAQIKNARADSLDYHAFWRTFDLAAAAAFAGRDAQSLKNDPRFSDMQRWGDGWPVKRLGVETPRPAAQPGPTATGTAATGTAAPRR